MKQQQGNDMYAVGGAMLVSSLMSLGLVDELRLLVTPPYPWRRKSTFQGCEGPACIETRPSEIVQVGQGQSDLCHTAGKNVKIMKEKTLTVQKMWRT
jgi:dihydrofolate reductase